MTTHWVPGLAGTPWSVRRAAGPGSRAALEIYEAGAVLDVMVDTPVAPRILRGARRAGQGRRRPAAGPGSSRRAGARGRRGLAIAWGRLPADAAVVTVTFAGGRLRPRATPAKLACLTAWCWVAVADGRYHRVTVSYGSGQERAGLRKARPW